MQILLLMMAFCGLSWGQVKTGQYSIPGVQSRSQAGSYWLEPGERSGGSCFQSDGGRAYSDDVVLKLKIVEDPKIQGSYIGEFNGKTIPLVFLEHANRPGGRLSGEYRERSPDHRYLLRIDSEVLNGELVGYGQYSDVIFSESEVYNPLSCDKKKPMWSQGTQFYQGYSIYPVKYDPKGKLILQWKNKKITLVP